jgi:hypothetical protein
MATAPRAIQMLFLSSMEIPHMLPPATDQRSTAPHPTPAIHSPPKKKFLDQCRDVARYRQPGRIVNAGALFARARGFDSTLPLGPQE